VKNELENFIKNLKKNRKTGEILTKQVGLIPLYDPKFKTEYKFDKFGKNLRLVGDAAGHVKATTGGGIVMGCLAARTITSENYEKEWRKKIGKELYLHLKIREVLNKNYKKLDKILEFANESPK